MYKNMNLLTKFLIFLNLIKGTDSLATGFSTCNEHNINGCVNKIPPFKKLDLNRDGEITFEEFYVFANKYTEQWSDGHIGFISRQYARYDLNTNGVLDNGEYRLARAIF